MSSKIDWTFLRGCYRGEPEHLPWRKMVGRPVLQSPLGAAVFLLLPPTPTGHSWPPLSLWATVIKSALGNGTNELIHTAAMAK